MVIQVCINPVNSDQMRPLHQASDHTLHVFFTFPESLNLLTSDQVDPDPPTIVKEASELRRLREGIHFQNQILLNGGGVP